MKLKAYKKTLIIKKMKFTGGNKVEYDFGEYKTFKDLFRGIYFGNISWKWGRKKARWI